MPVSLASRPVPVSGTSVRRRWLAVPSASSAMATGFGSLSIGGISSAALILSAKALHAFSRQRAGPFLRRDRHGPILLRQWVCQQTHDFGLLSNKPEAEPGVAASMTLRPLSSN